MTLIESLGFQYHRTKGSHQVFKHPRTGVELNVQPDRGQAKPYQVRDLAQMIKMHGLRLED